MGLTVSDVKDTHRYLDSAFDDDQPISDIASIGAPYACPSCDVDSLLVYRCSACGHDLTGDG